MPQNDPDRCRIGEIARIVAFVDIETDTQNAVVKVATHQAVFEALENSSSPIMTRQRLKLAQRQIYAQLETCPEL